MVENVYDYYFENYLMLYSMYGRGRPRLSRERYEELDRELLNLVDDIPTGGQEHDGGHREFNRNTFNRIRELEYILLDDLSEALMDKSTPEIAPAEPEKPTSLEFTWSDDAGSLAP